ncbi:MAG: octaprenyl-diphosphate synthase [Solirubrobacteraceae bacterium]|nr:octaprenyl-diphosphate synthase [Solirubrobacteraceae bacterium]
MGVAGRPDEPVTLVIEAGGAHLARLLAAVEARLRDIAAAAGGPVAGWAGATIAAGGKRLRPLLVLLAAGEAPAAEVPLVRAAVSVELVHAATLVHDDVLDAAALRRGRPTVWATDGRAAAVATGDHLFARAFSELAANDDVEQVRVLSRASSALAEGELLQRADAWDVAVAPERYLLRCELKTARLFEAACELGEANRPPPAAAPQLGAFGRRIGLAFQLLDDVLDVSGPAERTGKHRGTDLLDGTVTLPLILARAVDPELAALDLRAVRTAEEAERICDAIAATGALEQARERALRLVAEAKELLPEELDAEQRRALLLVADGVVARYA